MHRDHYTLASVIGREYGAHVSLGIGDKPTLDLMHDAEATEDPTLRTLRSAGAVRIADEWSKFSDGRLPDLSMWGYPDSWLDGDHPISVGTRTLDAVHTPGHTQGHFVFADRAAGLLFAGDHVLPTITPSIGFEPVPVEQPLRDFLGSLTKVRGLPDLRLLPAHGPVAPSSHTRIDQLLAFHEVRLQLCLDALAGGPGDGVRRRAGAAAGPGTSTGSTTSTSSTRHWPAWRPRPTSSCWWHAGWPPAR